MFVQPGLTEKLAERLSTKQDQGVDPAITQKLAETLSGVRPDEEVQDASGRSEELEPKVEEAATPTESELGESPEGEDEAGTEAASGTADGEESGEINTLVDFAKAAGWEPEDLYDLKVRLDTDEEVRFGDLKDQLQEFKRVQASVAAREKSLAEQEKALKEAKTQATTASQNLSQEMVTALATMEATQQQFNAINWEELEKEDPGRASLLQQKLATRYSQAQAEYGEAVQKQRAEQQKLFNEQVEEHNKQLLTAVPEWQDPRVYEVEQPQITKFLNGLGFKDEELNTIVDYRARVVARKAWLWDKHQADVAKAKEKVLAKPKPVLRPGATAVPQGPAKQAHDIKKLKQRALETGRKSDKLAAARAVLAQSLGQ